MFDILNDDQKFDKNERTLSRLEKEFDGLLRQMGSIFDALDIDIEESKALIEEKEGLLPEELKDIEKRKAELQDLLDSELANVEDAEKRKKTFAELKNIGRGSRI